MSRKRRGPVPILIAVLAASSLGWSWEDLFQNRAEKAVKLYEEGRVEEAIELYREEAIENPDRPDVSYNLGNMLYRAGKYNDALPMYEQAAASPERGFKEAALFNTGNTLARIGMESGDGKALEHALEAFKGAMRLAPLDQDPKYNYEFVKKLLEHEKQDRDQSAAQDSSGAGQEEEEQARQDEGEGKEEDGKKQENEPAPSPGDQEEQRNENAPKSPLPNMSEEDARRMLEALMGKEEEQLAKQLRALWPERVDVEKDW